MSSIRIRVDGAAARLPPVSTTGRREPEVKYIKPEYILARAGGRASANCSRADYGAAVFTMFGEHVIPRTPVWGCACTTAMRGWSSEQASRCRRPGFHECLNGVGGSIREILQEARPSPPFSFLHRPRFPVGVTIHRPTFTQPTAIPVRRLHEPRIHVSVWHLFGAYIYKYIFFFFFFFLLRSYRQRERRYRCRRNNQWNHFHPRARAR